MIYRRVVVATVNLQVQLAVEVPLAFKDSLDRLGSKVIKVQQVQWEELVIQVNAGQQCCASMKVWLYCLPVVMYGRADSWSAGHGSWVMGQMGWQIWTVTWVTSQYCKTLDPWLGEVETCKRLSIVFTALHGMQSRYSDGNSVCPSVRSSVRLSVCQTRALWQNGRKLSPYFYTTR